MYLTKSDYTTEDFLKAIGFIAPRGYSVAYFITPQNISLPNGTGFMPQLKDIPPDESQTYVLTPPVEKIDQALSPAEYSVWNPNELGRRQPTPNVLPPVTEPEDLDSPFVKTLSESKTFGTDLKLLEDYYMFPKNTVFHCVENKLNEATLDKRPGWFEGHLMGGRDLDVRGSKEWEDKVKHDSFHMPTHDRWGNSRWNKYIWELYKEGHDENEIYDILMQEPDMEISLKKGTVNPEDLKAMIHDWVWDRAEMDYSDAELRDKGKKAWGEAHKRLYTKRKESMNFKEIYNKANKLNEVKKPGWFKRSLEPDYINNQTGLYTTGLGSGIDNYIDESLKDGMSVNELTADILSDKTWRKNFEGSYKNRDETVEEGLKKYIFRRQQALKSGEWTNGLDGQQLLPFNETFKEIHDKAQLKEMGPDSYRPPVKTKYGRAILSDDFGNKYLDPTDYLEPGEIGSVWLNTVCKPLTLRDVWAGTERHPSIKDVREGDDKFFKKMIKGRIDQLIIEPTKGWVRYDNEKYPSIYVDSSGFNYPRYVGIDQDDERKWRDILDA